MRISDWSSDVCSSDLTNIGGRTAEHEVGAWRTRYRPANGCSTTEAGGGALLASDIAADARAAAKGGRGIRTRRHTASDVGAIIERDRRAFAAGNTAVDLFVAIILRATVWHDRSRLVDHNTSPIGKIGRAHV